MRWSDAQASFALALTCDAQRTRYAAWYYPAFVLAQGHSRDALQLVEERAKENPEDTLSQTVRGIFLYLCGKSDEAVFALALAETMNSRQWLTRTASALLALARNEPAAAHVILVHQLIGDDVFPGLLALCLAAALRLRAAPEQWGPSRANAGHSLFEQIYAALDELLDTLPKPPLQLAQLVNASKERYIPPLQLALAYMAVDETSSAMRSLKLALDEPCPILAWMHVMPIFDSVRNLPDFKKLLEEAGLPPSMKKDVPRT
jgi:tetratricopeptide (TPR) repeat protein